MFGCDNKAYLKGDKKMKLQNMGSNKTKLIKDNWEIFFSYNTPVVATDCQGRWFVTDKKWSVTTSKHINQFLGGMIAERRDQSFFDNLL